MRNVVNPKAREEGGLRFFRIMIGGIVVTIVALALIVATSGHFFSPDSGLF